MMTKWAFSEDWGDFIDPWLDPWESDPEEEELDPEVSFNPEEEELDLEVF